MAKEDLTQTRLSSVLIRDKYTVCGVGLKPLCLGHIIILESLNNPTISEEVQEVEITGGICCFFLSLIICALSYEEGLKLLDDQILFEKTIKQFCDNLSKNMEAEPGWNFIDKMNLFNKYMSTHLESMPYYDLKSTSTGTDGLSGGDWKSSIFLVFKKMGYSATEIYNMPIDRLFFEWVSWAESEGQLTICNKYAAAQLKQFNKK